MASSPSACDPIRPMKPGVRKDKTLCRLGFVAAFLLILPLAGHLTCGPPAYWSEPIQGTIVDKETGQPLPGAVVFAEWVLFQPGLGHGGHADAIHVAEAIADDHGAFLIGGWGPKLRPACQYLPAEQPQLLVFKSGYEPLRIAENRLFNMKGGYSEWDGKSIPLVPLRVVEQRYIDSLRWRSQDVESDCERLPPGMAPIALLAEIKKEQVRLTEITSGVSLRDGPTPGR